ncbi:MAG: DUF3473 domain-containing protein [Neomegalonema sp.]|nr:DUF3473 domain-containing protein [Neomegalonema sp.]
MDEAAQRAQNATNPAPIRGAMSIDVEDYYHVSGFEGVVQRADWPNFESRVAQSTNRLLDLFAAKGAKATFFTLGVVARDNPQIVRRIVEDGHELASHGWEHCRVFHESRQEFRDELRRTKHLLEDLGGVEVKGYRAPSFSITAATPWAFEELAATGHRYSSSANPITGNRYGCPEEPHTPWHDEASGISEIPITTLKIRTLSGKTKRISGGGGGYFRLLPGALFRRAAEQSVAEGTPPNFYLHPWEIDPGQPRIKGIPLPSRLRHYANLAQTEARLARHLQAFTWDRMDRVYANWIA